MHDQQEEAKLTRHTLVIIRHASVTIFVFNLSGSYPCLDISSGQRFQELIAIQSISAVIQNMLLINNPENIFLQDRPSMEWSKPNL